MPRGVTVDSAVNNNPYYESWSCNMKYFTDGRERTKESTVDMIFYEGNNLIRQKDGTFKSSNAIN